MAAGKAIMSLRDIKLSSSLTMAEAPVGRPAYN